MAPGASNMEQPQLGRARGGVYRRTGTRCPRLRSQWLFIAVAFVLCLSSAATVVAHPHRPVRVPSEPDTAVVPTVEAPTPVEETLLIDTRPPPSSDGHLAVMAATEQDTELKARNPQGSSSTKSGSTTTSQASPLPSLLEENLSGNFTKPNPQSSESPCGSFLATLVANETFQQCYPFSVLLLGSKSFFQAQKSLVGITNVLDRSCKADVKLCSSYLSGIATQLISKDNCGVDYDMQNSVVTQLRSALLSYETLFSATCLRDPTSQAYCFASAVTNSSNAQNTYFYYLPMNSSLPTDSSPNCNWCVRETMAIYQANAANRKLPIAATYSSAAIEVNSHCGASFVNATMPAEVQSAGVRLLAGPPPWTLLSAVGLALAMQLLI
ncbi:hypothetical protein RB595_000477 [Gaeumannomyces hyphopodioides]